LQPPFFSMVLLHLGHSLVLAEIQLAVSESSAHFLSHFLTNSHGAGWWSLRAHPKQKRWPHRHATVGTIRSRSFFLTPHSTTSSQSGAGHHLRVSLSSPYVRWSSSW